MSKKSLYYYFSDCSQRTTDRRLVGLVECWASCARTRDGRLLITE